MRPLKRLLIPLLAFALFLAATSAQAEYIFSNGYYWSNGAAYTRAKVYYYDSYGCKRYRYQYTAVPVITSKTEGWLEKLIALKASRDRYQATLETSANEHNKFIEAVRELGLDDPYGNPAIGYATINRSHPYAIQGGYNYSQLSAAQGSTHYGYAPAQFTQADVYGNVDLGALYNISGRLAENANQYGAKATSGFMSLVDQFSSRAASLQDRAIAVKEIEAKTSGITQVSQAIAASIRAEARASIIHAQAGNGQPPEPDGPMRDAIQNGTLSNIADVIAYRCATCHRPGGKMEAFDLTDLSSVSEVEAGKILDRTTTSDPAKRMPPDKPLSLQELRIVLAAAVSQQPAKED